MTTYFEVKNENGTNIQLNDKDYIYSFNNMGSFSNIYTGYNIYQSIRPYSTGITENGRFYYYRFDLDGTNQIIYVYNPSSNLVKIVANNTVFGGVSGGSFKRTVKCIIFGVLASNKTIADNLQFIVFKKNTKTAGNSGLNVFNSSGSLVFSSNDKNLIIRKASFCVNGSAFKYNGHRTYYSTTNNVFDTYENTFSYPIGANFDVGMGLFGSGPFGEHSYYGAAVQLCTLSNNYVKIEPSKYVWGDYSNTSPYDVEVCENTRNYSIYSICDLSNIV